MCLDRTFQVPCFSDRLPYGQDLPSPVSQTACPTAAPQSRHDAAPVPALCGEAVPLSPAGRGRSPSLKSHWALTTLAKQYSGSDTAEPTEPLMSTSCPLEASCHAAMKLRSDHSLREAQARRRGPKRSHVEKRRSQGAGSPARPFRRLQPCLPLEGGHVTDPRVRAARPSPVNPHQLLFKFWGGLLPRTDTKTDVCLVFFNTKCQEEELWQVIELLRA